MMDDEQLLHAYARTRSESAFGELVTRHIDFVYSAALRVVNGDSHLAQDVAQTVFIELAREAGSLTDDVALPGWLHRHTCYTATKAVRTERRRQSREQTAMEMRALDDNTRPEWELVAPYLDESLNQLNPADRDALVLRFLKQQDLRAVGAALGISDDAAQKRVDRALEKLHVLLKHRGATLSAAALGTALATEGVTAVPAGLAGAVTAAALSGTTITSAVTATKAIAMTTLQKTLIGATLTLAVGTGIYEARQISRLREQNLALQQQQAPLTEQIQQLTQDRDDATRQLAALRDDNDRLSRNTAELRKLRAEIGPLRRQMNSNDSGNTRRPLSEWLQEYDTKAADLKPEAKNAIRQMGTNSIPELLRMLRSESSGNIPWRVTCAFRALGQEARTAVPALIEILQSSASMEMRVQAAASLGFVGPEAQAAIPALIAALGDKESIPMRMNSIGALTRIGGDPSVLVPVFTASLDDPFWDVRIWASTGLSKFGSQAESAVPKLMEALSNTDEEAKVLVDLTKALETIGPTTNGAAPVLLKLLSNPNQGVRMGATNALIRIDPAAAASAQVK